jgi:hypothetical protein
MQNLERLSTSYDIDMYMPQNGFSPDLAALLSGRFCCCLTNNVVGKYWGVNVPLPMYRSSLFNPTRLVRFSKG